MGNVENLEHQIKSLSPTELAAFREWFLAYEWETWDHQFEKDVEAGKLDTLADKALRDHAAGKSTKF